MKEDPAPSATRRAAWYIVALLSALLVCSFIDRLILAVIAAPVSAELHISDQRFGLLMGAGFALFYALVGLPSAQFLDRGARVRMVGVGALLWGVASLTSAFARDFAWLAVCRAVLAFGEAVLTPATMSLIPDLFARDKRALPMSIYFSVPVVSMTLTYLLGGATLHLASLMEPFTGLAPWRMTLVIVSLPTLTLSLLMLCTVREPARSIGGVGEEQQDYTSVRTALAYFRAHARFYLGFYVAMAAVGTLWYGMLSWLPTAFVRAFGQLPADASSRLGMVGIPTGILGAFVWPWLSDRLEQRGWSSAKLWIQLATVMLAAFASLGYLAATHYGAAATFGFISFLLAANSPLGSLILQSATPARLRARAAAMQAMGTSVLSYSLGSWSVAFVGEHFFPGRPNSLFLALVATALPLGAIAVSCFLLIQPGMRSLGHRSTVHN